MQIPHDQLTQETLRAVVLEFVSREGTDYGHKDWDMEDKIAQVLAQIRCGKVLIFYDAKTKSCNLMMADAVHIHHEVEEE